MAPDGRCSHDVRQPHPFPRFRIALSHCGGRLLRVAPEQNRNPGRRFPSIHRRQAQHFESGSANPANDRFGCHVHDSSNCSFHTARASVSRTAAAALVTAPPSPPSGRPPPLRPRPGTSPRSAGYGPASSHGTQQTDCSRDQELRRFLGVGEASGRRSPSAPRRRGNRCRPASSPGSRPASSAATSFCSRRRYFSRMRVGDLRVLAGPRAAACWIAMNWPESQLSFTSANACTIFGWPATKRHAPADHVEALRHRVNLDADLLAPRRPAGSSAAGRRSSAGCGPRPARRRSGWCGRSR